MAFCAIVSGSDCIESCLSTRSVRPPKSLCIIVSSPSRHENEAVHSVRCRQFPFTPFCQTAVHSRISVGLPARRPPPLLASTRTRSDDLRLATASGAGACFRTSVLIRNPQLVATPLTAVPFHLQPRRERSNGRPRRRAVRAVFHRLFSLPMKHLGSVPRSIFPFAKVGLTAHRKIYLTDFYTKFQ